MPALWRTQSEDEEEEEDELDAAGVELELLEPPVPFDDPEDRLSVR